MAYAILLTYSHTPNLEMLSHLNKTKTSVRYDNILLWLRMENGLLTSDLLTHLLSYPQSRDNIKSKHNKPDLIELFGILHHPKSKLCAKYYII